MSGVRELVERLELPAAARTRFLDEVAGDLEGLYEALRARGLGRREAWRAAAEMLLPDDHALRALMVVHRPLWFRWAERLTGRGGAAEAALLVVLTVMMAVATLAALVNGGVLAPLSWALAPMIAIGIVESALIAWHATRVLARGEARAESLRAGARAIAVVGGAAVAAGLLCAGIGFARAADGAATAGATTAPLLHWLPTALAQLSLGLVIALEGASAWLLLGRRAARLEYEAARAIARIRGFHFPAA